MGFLYPITHLLCYSCLLTPYAYLSQPIISFCPVELCTYHHIVDPKRLEMHFLTVGVLLQLNPGGKVLMSEVVCIIV